MDSPPPVTRKRSKRARPGGTCPAALRANGMFDVGCWIAEFGLRIADCGIEAKSRLPSSVH